MKFNTYIVALFMLIGSTVIACKKQEIPAKPQPSAFSACLEGNPGTFPASGGSVNLVVIAGEDGWSVSAAQNDWLVISRVYGAGDFKIPVTIKPNTTGAARTVQVKVKPTFNLPTAVISISQTQ